MYFTIDDMNRIKNILLYRFYCKFQKDCGISSTKIRFAKANLISLSIITIIAFTFFSCKKDVGDCFTNTGKIITENRTSEDFNLISLNNNVNLILTQDSVNTVMVEAGKNIISSIKTEFVNGHLNIKNTSSCNWLRSYAKNINVYVSVKRLDSLKYKSSGNVSCTNTIKNDSISIDVWGGAGTIELDLDMRIARLNIHYGTVDMIFHGSSSVTYIYAASYGPFHCEDLYSGNVYINNRGTNDCYVRAKKVLEATIENIGNIYYYGNPEVVSSNITGEGELIKME